MTRVIYLFVCSFCSYICAAQNTGVGTKIPSYTLTVKDSLQTSNNEGFAQVSPNGQVAVGTYVTNSTAYLQTHTKTNLNFATNNGSAAMTLDTLNNLGIGITNPAEKLDVAGNMNVNGQLKVNNNAGTAGQVLMKNGSNNPAWADLSDYKYLAVYDCSNVALSAGANNCNNTWTVPAGVTSLYVEGWSGGGGGGTMSGGGGGGYIAFQVTVTPGTILTLITGAAGSSGNSTASGISGGGTSINVNSGTYSVNGGSGGASGNPFNNFFGATSASAGGGLSGSGALSGHVISQYGGTGKPTTINFQMVSAGEYARSVNFGDGGDVAMYPSSAGKGGFAMISTTNNLNVSVNAGYGGPHGSGGAADLSGGRSGVGGIIIIHY